MSGSPRCDSPLDALPTNIFNASLNYSPVGAVRAFRGVVDPTHGLRDMPRRVFNSEERARLLIQAVGGSLAMAGYRVTQIFTGIPADMAIPFSNFLRQVDPSFNLRSRDSDGPAGKVGHACRFYETPDPSAKTFSDSQWIAA